jgi:nitrate reductase molybdenum cofactor assembly chaperone NarJ/NarW
MAKTFKALSALLSYPSAELQKAAGEMRTVIEMEGLVPVAIRRQLDALLTDIAEGDLYDLQERYVVLFDRTRSLSLHLFEHVHGESRDRGQAMVDLLAMYEERGLAAVKNELPDFLPLFLEFLATLPQVEACEMLGQPAHILAAMAERLRKRKTPYEAVFRALTALSSVKPKGEEVSALLELPDPDPMDLAVLDAAWEDEAVMFGPGAGDNCKDTLMAQIRGGLRPAPDMPMATRANPRQ